MLSMLSPILTALDGGAIAVIDEIDTSLHTLLAKKLVEMFANAATNKSGAQLIFTTHDTNLLAGDLLRSDEIWFTEKGRSGSTALFPLSDFRTRAGDNLERGYLQGRFGAIPFIGGLERL
jgi:uncharacterized protein